MTENAAKRPAKKPEALTEQEVEKATGGGLISADFEGDVKVDVKIKAPQDLGPDIGSRRGW